MGSLSDLLGTGKTAEDDPQQDGPDAPTPDTSGDDAPELPADPPPSRRSRKGRRTAARATNVRTTATKADRDQVRDALTMLYTLPAWGLTMKDPHCGGVLMQQRDDIIKSLVPIVCRNPGMLAFFTAANAPWMDYLALMQALLPVGQAVWGHHVTRTVGPAAPDEQAAGGGLVDLTAYTA
jgi:hypothetical protein